jgi:hypothetical protein
MKKEIGEMDQISYIQFKDPVSKVFYERIDIY